MVLAFTLLHDLPETTRAGAPKLVGTTSGGYYLSASYTSQIGVPPQATYKRLCGCVFLTRGLAGLMF